MGVTIVSLEVEFMEVGEVDTIIVVEDHHTTTSQTGGINELCTLAIARFEQ